jgi:hypothetical protein
MDTETNLEAEEAPEVEELPVEGDEPEEIEVELDEDGNPIEEPPEPEVDLADVEIDGKAYKLPSELKDKFLMQADYTRKTQELAEQRKAVEATLQQLGSVSQEEQQAMVQVGLIDAQIAEYNDIDWQAWDQSDPQSAQNARLQLLMLNEQRRNAAGQYSQAQHQRTLLQQQETAKLLEQGAAVLRERIPGWGQDKATALQSHAIEAYGFSPQDLATVVDPRMIQVLHDAWQFRQTSKTQQAAKKVQAQQAIQPAAKIPTGKPAARGLDDRMSAEEWVKARNAQLAKRK